MTLDKRIGTAEGKLGSYTYEEYRQASHRHVLRFLNVLYFEGWAFLEAFHDANPKFDPNDNSQWDRCVPVKVGGPFVVDMTERGFERDQDILDECARSRPELVNHSDRFSCGRSYWEMKEHFYRKFIVAMAA